MSCLREGSGEVLSWLDRLVNVGLRIIRDGSILQSIGFIRILRNVIMGMVWWQGLRGRSENVGCKQWGMRRRVDRGEAGDRG